MKIHLHIVFLQRPIPTSPLSSPKSQKIYRDRQLSTSVADSQKLQQTMDVSHWIFLGTPKDSRLRIVSTVKDTLLAWFPNFAVAFRLSTFHISTLCHNVSHWKIWSFWSILSIPPKLPRTHQFCQMGNHKQLIWPLWMSPVESPSTVTCQATVAFWTLSSQQAAGSSSKHLGWKGSTLDVCWHLLDFLATFRYSNMASAIIPHLLRWFTN